MRVLASLRNDFSEPTYEQAPGDSLRFDAGHLPALEPPEIAWWAASADFEGIPPERAAPRLFARASRPRPSTRAPSAPSGLAIAAFSLSIPGSVLPGIGFVSLGLAIAALIRDRHAARKRWAGWWAQGLSIWGTVAYLGLILRAAG